MQHHHRRPRRAAKKGLWGFILAPLVAFGAAFVLLPGPASATSDAISESCDGETLMLTNNSGNDGYLTNTGGDVFVAGGATVAFPGTSSFTVYTEEGSVIGTADYKECVVDPPPPTDTDGDGVNDDEDLCVNEAGPASNNGCPESPPDKVCDNLDTGHLSANDQTTFTYTAPDGYVIVGFCVKAGSANQGDGPEYCPGEAWCPSLPATSITFSHSTGKQISHFSVDLEKVTPPPPVCPEGTDHAGTPIDDLDDNNGDGTVDSDDCDELPPPPPPKCPPGTDHEGEKIRDLDDNNGDGTVDSDDCDEPEPPKQCPDGSTVPADKDCPKPVCPNLPGGPHYKVPDGMVMNQDGNCGVPQPPVTPGTPNPPVVEVPPYGMVPTVPADQVVPVAPNTQGSDERTRNAGVVGVTVAVIYGLNLLRRRYLRA